MKAKGYGTTVAVLVSALLLAACGGAATTSTASSSHASTTTKSGTSSSTGAASTTLSSVLVYGLSSEPPSLDPNVDTGSAAETVEMQLYRGLFRFNSQGKVVNELASSYKVVSPTEYTFTLRPNLKFSDGSPLTAADVVFTINRIETPKVGGYLYKDFQDIKSITAVNPTTVQMVLKKPDAPLLSQLALPQAAIVSKTFTLAHGNSLKDVTLGDGPYKLKVWNHGQNLVVVKNPDWYNTSEPKTPEINFKFYPSGTARVAALESGAVDIIGYVPWQNIKGIKANSSLVFQGSLGPFMYLTYNMTQKPFNNALVREAIGFAVNRQQVLKDAFFGYGQPIDGLPIPQSSFAYVPSLEKQYSFDPAKAKALLKQAGYPSCFSATLLSTSQYGMHKDTAEVVANDMNAIGCHIKLSLPDWATRVATGNSGNYQFSVMGTAGKYNDPDFIASFFTPGPTYYAYSVGYNDPKMTSLLVQARSVVSQSQRKTLYTQVQQLALKDVPYTFLTWRVQGFAWKKTVSGFSNYPGFLTFYSPYALDNTTMAK